MIHSDTPLVFLHAYPLDASQWDGMADRFPGRPVIAPDLPGFGGREANERTLDGFARTVLTAMDEAGFATAVIVGLSMGGYVAFRLHDRAPERIVGLVLADTRAGADTEEARAKRTAQADRARREGIAWLADAFIPSALSETTRRERPEIVARVRKLVERATPDGVANALLAMRDRPDSTPQLPGIRVPVLALVGEEDELTPVSESRLIADGVANGTLRVIPGSGHLSSFEDPDAFVEALEAFLGGTGPRDEG